MSDVDDHFDFLSCSSMEEKTLWWNVLKKTVESQRSLESERTIPIRILNRNEDQNNKTPLSLPVTNKDDVKSTLKMALDGFEIQNVNPCEYQLWVVSGKENAAYPLIGHEIPYCIKMNHVRQSNANSPNASPLPDNELNLKPESPKSRCEFILKKKKDSRPRIEFGEFILSLQYPLLHSGLEMTDGVRDRVVQSDYAVSLQNQQPLTSTGVGAVRLSLIMEYDRQPRTNARAFVNSYQPDLGLLRCLERNTEGQFTPWKVMALASCVLFTSSTCRTMKRWRYIKYRILTYSIDEEKMLV
eukprot:gene86-686_t